VPWQIVTYSFLHANLAHLALNMFGLWTFGRDVERTAGSLRFATLYAALEIFWGVTGTAAGIAHFAHLGGMVGALLVIRRWRRQ